MRLNKLLRIQMICPETLNLINTMANIVIAVLAFVAVFTYFYNKDKDNILAVVDQVSFFREKVLSEGNNFIRFVRDKDKDYIFSRIKLDDPTTKTIKEKYKSEVTAQVNLIKTYGKHLQSLQIDCLNLLEEFSLRVIYSETYTHRAFNSVKPLFIELVEMLALQLMTQREIITGNQAYSATLKLYSKWKDEVDRSSPEERTKKTIESYEEI